MAATIVFPQVIVDTIVEVKEFHVLEFRLGCGKQFFGARDMIVHRAPNIEQHQYLDAVLALRLHLDVKVAGIVGGGADRIVQRQFLFRALSRKFAQAAQCDLDVARAKFALVIVVAIRTRFPHLDCGAIAAFTADADTFRILAAVAER